MENRLPKLILRQILSLLFLLLLEWSLFAQVEFSFAYTGPETLYVGADCTTPLDWGHPGSLTATCTNNGGGCTVDTLEIFSISDNYQLNDPILAGELVLITYRAVSQANSAEDFFSFSIPIVDTSSPVWTTTPMDLIIECGDLADPEDAIADWLVNNGQGVVMDNCNLALVTNDYIGLSNGCNQTGMAEVTFTAIDSFGNSSSRQARVAIEDTQPPNFIGPSDITIDCSAGTNPSLTGQVLQVQDGCDMNPDTSYNDIITSGPCVNSFTVTRTWILSDVCGNIADPYVQRISVRDETAPVFLLPASNTSINCTTAAAAEATFQAWITNNGEAVVVDGCSPDNRLAFFAAVPGSYDLNNPLSFPGTSVGSLDMANCPSSDPNVYRSETVDFVFYDECNNAAMSRATFQITDNVAPVFNTCPQNETLTTNPGSCEADYILPFAEVSEACVHLMSEAYISWQYQINDLAPQDFTPAEPTPVLLEGGANSIRYLATDCTGNTVECLFTVTVTDAEMPVLVCPSDMTLSIDSLEDCNMGTAFSLPPLTNISDNCALANFNQTQPSNSSDALLRFSYNADYEEYIADDKRISFVGTAANAVGTDVQLILLIEGDVEEAEAYFTIRDEDGNDLGTTAPGQPNIVTLSGNCNSDPPQLPSSWVSLSVPVPLFNTWAADGSVDFDLIANQTFSIPAPGGNGDGINPICIPFLPGTPDQTIDSLSRLSMQLIYSYTNLSYSASGATSIPLTAMPSPSFTVVEHFQIGSSEITYQIQDVQGNAGTCSFIVNVEDQVAPLASCMPATIFVNPSGMLNYILEADEVDDASSDNCALIDRMVKPNLFTCDMAGTTQTVELIVADEFGNQDTCETLVRIETAAPEPDYSVGLCGNDTLYLFANPPPAPNGVNYTYQWSGPNSFSAFIKDPFIPNANSSYAGTYTVEVTGLTGCTAINTVEVLINPIPNTPVLQANSNQLCVNDELILSTQTYTGNVVNYNWYSGIWPGGSYMTTTNIPSLLIPPPLVTNTYYVIVEVDACSSAASAFTLINVSNTPTASVNDAFINICQGASFALGTMVAGANYTYSWTGPDGYTSTDQYPEVIDDASLAQAGNYTLVVAANGCPSDPVHTTVNIRPKPTQPEISGDNLACEGGNITLYTNNTNADFYIWTAPDFSTRTTTASSLTLTGVTASDEGNWTLQSTLNGCSSENSDSFQVFIEPAPMLIAVNDGPGCAGGEVQLSANEIPGANYEWAGPGGFNAIGQEVIAPANIGTYSVTVTTSLSCTSTATTFVDVQALPEVTAISSTAANCVDGMTPVQLQATIFPADDGSYTYQWSGPGAFFSTDPSPALLTGTSADNGIYELVVSDGSDCPSMLATTTIDLQDVPLQPLLEAPPFVCEGGALILNTSTYAGNSITYIWNTPLGTRTTASPELTIVPATAASSGMYSVRVEVDGCISENSLALTIEVASTLPAPIAIGNGPVCEGQPIELSTEEISGAEYRWIGPNDFKDSVRSPIILDAMEINEGAYSVQIIINGCSSPFSVPVGIQINTAPSAPELEQDGPVCIDEAGAGLVLTITNGTATPGANYIFYDAQSQIVVGGPTSSTSLLVNDFSNYSQGMFGFYVIAELDGCPSAASIPVMVSMDSIPDIEAMAGDDQKVCDESSSILSAMMPSVGSGEWLQIAGPTISIQNTTSATTNISGLSPDNVYQFQWTLSNGACQNYAMADLEVLVNNTSEMADAGEDIELCNETVTILEAQVPLSGATGRWTQSASQQVAGVTIESPMSAISGLSGLLPGNVYTFNWLLNNPACGDYDNDELMVIVEANQVVADAGEDFSYCGDGSLELMASPSDDGLGHWEVINSDVELINPEEPDAMAENLISGLYTFVWVVDYGVCGIAADTLLVDYTLAPLAEDDEFIVPFAGKLEFNVLDNDQLEENDFTISILTEPAQGEISYLGGGIYEYRPVVNYAGEDVFTYLICSETCPDICDEGSVILSVGNIGECEAPSIFTPNNDLVNDVFLVPCLATDRYPGNKVIIFNQWGDEVFTASPYQNDWAGTYNGNDLPAGTYFYVIDLGTDEAPLTGFLVLER